jgi:hypothetical protein
MLVHHLYMYDYIYIYTKLNIVGKCHHAYLLYMYGSTSMQDAMFTLYNADSL